MIRKFYRSFLLLLITGCTTGAVSAQTTEDSVKSVVNNLFAAMKGADPQFMRTVFADSAVLQTISRDKSGKTIIRNENVADFIDFVGKQTKGAADEQITFNSIKIDGALASVWTPYKFYYNGNFSHCGVNSFQLVRLSGGWKIQYLIDTRRKTNCE